MTDLLDSPEPSTPDGLDSSAATSTGQTGSRLVDGLLTAGHHLDTLVAPTGRTVVVVPHPDDEALAVGGLIAHQRARGRDVAVIAVTDGDAAYPDWNGAELARTRRGEQLGALTMLGVTPRAVRRLGVPDGAVGHHVDSIVRALLELLSPGDTIVAPASFDWHPDHEACGRAASAAADKVGCTLLSSLFWAHHHPEHAPPTLSVARLALSDDETARRRAAVGAHRSQVKPSPRTAAAPILSDEWLGVLDHPVEYYVLDRPTRPAGVA